MDLLDRQSLDAICYHLEMGKDNADIGRDALAAFLRTLPTKADAALTAARQEEREANCRAIRAACTMCDGTGGENVLGGYVTHDMALDAGAPEMEGEPIPYQRYECEYCGWPIATIQEDAIRRRTP